MALDLFFPLLKFDPIKGIIEGTAALEEPDKSGEIFDYATSKPNFEKWSAGIDALTKGKSKGNVREMHQPVAAGKLTEITFDDVGKRIRVVAQIVDKDVLGKLAEGVYTGFSIGGKYAKKWEDPTNPKLMRYTADPSELSVVDNACMYSATFDVVKEDGTKDLRKFHEPTAGASPAAPVVLVSAPEPTAPAPTESTTTVAKAAEPAPEKGPKQVWQARDGKTFAKKSEAEAHDVELEKAAAAAATPEGKLAAELAAFKADVTKIAETPAAAPKSGSLGKKDYTDDQRKEMADKGEAMPDGQYPIADKADLHDAIQSFGRAKNKKATKAHIIKRAKALGASDELPDSWKDGAEKSARFDELLKGTLYKGVRLTKGLYDVGRLACIINDLRWLQQDLASEAAWEGDNSPVPAALKEACATLVGILDAVCSEESSELFTNEECIEFVDLLEMSAPARGVNALAKVLGAKAPEWLTKASASRAASDKAHLDAAHDHLSKMGVGCGAETDAEKMAKAGLRHTPEVQKKLAKAHDMLASCGADCDKGDPDKMHDAGDDAGDDDQAQKAAGVTPPIPLRKQLEDAVARNAALEKQMTETTASIAELRKTVGELWHMPVPRPHERLRVVGKGQDDGDPGSSDDPADVAAKLAEIAKSDPRTFAKALVMAAHQHPNPVSGT